MALDMTEPVAYNLPTMPSIVKPPISPYRGLRSIDAYGSGGYGAPRFKDGERYRHKGQDFLGNVGDTVVAPITGRIVHIGIAYPDSDGVHGRVYLGTVHIVGAAASPFAELKVKLLYLSMGHAPVDMDLEVGQPFGLVQDVSGYHALRHPENATRMQNHIHLELYHRSILVDPMHWLDLPAAPEVA